MSYRFLDWIIEWQVDDYVKWDRAQQKVFDQRLQRLLDWHKQSQLAQYSQMLKRLQVDVQKPLEEPILEEHWVQIGMFWGDLMQRASVDAVALFASLNDEQVQTLLQNIDSDIDESEEKYQKRSQQELLDERYERMEKFSKRWVGRLNDEQEQLTQKWSQQNQNIWPLWLENRKKWAAAFADALQSRQQSGFQQKVTTLFSNSRSLWSEEYQKAIQANTNNTLSYAVEFHASLTPKQQKHLEREITQWVTLFDELAGEANVAQVSVVHSTVTQVLAGLKSTPVHKVLAPGLI